MNYNDSIKKLNSSYDNLDSLRINRSTHNRSILQTDKGLSRSLMIVPSDELYQVDLLIKKKRIMIQLLRQGLSAADAEYYVTQLELEDMIDMSVPALTQQVFSSQMKSSFEFESHRDPSRIRKQDSCGICMDQLSEPIIKLQCHHEFCEDCFNQACLDRIMTGNADRIICPEDCCQQLISDQLILQQLGQETHDKMMRFRLIKQMASNPRLKQCPRLGCERIFEITNKYICECGQRICKHCDQAYHPGISCEAQVDDQFNQMKKKMQIFECPKCNAPIQKNKGCNHMTCKVCQYQFCWLCRDLYTYKHYEGYNIFGCPGLQYKDWEPFTCPSFYRFLYVLAILIVIGPAAVIALVVITILGPSIITNVVCECLQVYRRGEVIFMLVLVNALCALGVVFIVLLSLYHQELANYWIKYFISCF